MLTTLHPQRHGQGTKPTDASILLGEGIPWRWWFWAPGAGNVGPYTGLYFIIKHPCIFKVSGFLGTFFFEGSRLMGLP